MTLSQITASALTVVAIANSLKAAKVTSQEFSEYNSVTDPGWNTLASGVPAAVDANGYIVGTNVKPSEVSNAIGSINVFLNYWAGAVVAQSAWGQNLEKISNPLV